MADNNIVPFGKHRGRTVEELLISDPAYLQWLSSQAWFRERFVYLHQVIINRGAESDETPEHNALQVKFIDYDFCYKFAKHLWPNFVEQKLKEETERNIKSVIYFGRKFEEQGVDVSFFVGIMWKADGEEFERYTWFYRCSIEIKPIVSDDYPAILRQMRANQSDVLLVEKYAGQGATREQFIETFKISNKRVVFVDDLT